MKTKLKTILLLSFDLFTAATAWLLFYIYRITEIEQAELSFKGNFFLGLIVLPVLWIFLYTIQGTYHNVLRLYRIKSLKLTFFGSLIGCLLIFFVFLLNDFVNNYTQLYTLFFLFLGLHFSLTIIPRMIYTTWHVKRIHAGKFGFNTIIIGGNDKAVNILDEIKKLKQNPGYKFIGYVNINGNDFKLDDKLPYLGKIDRISEIVSTNSIDEVIIALESSEHEKLKDILANLASCNVKIGVIPDAYDLLAGQVQMNSIFGALLLNITPTTMPDWQFSTKRILDIFLSLIAILLLTPVYLFLAILVKTSSKGPVFFSQERVGIHGKPFRIFKFRTMYVNAEKDGPQLSSSNDSRITKIGKFLRKTRLDEFPQFWNVLKGDMSLVGPRPERQFYIDQIAEKDPQYLYLHKVRPGITSWGQVKFGYAENVEQMVERMKYDLLYIRNMSLALDLKIMFYTIAIIFKGTGK